MEINKTLYISGDPVGCCVALSNRMSRPLSGVRGEFSEQRWH